MTEQEFRDEIRSTQDIYYFCCNNEYYDFIEDWVPIEELQDRIETELRECIGDYLRGSSWWDLRDALDNIDTDYYIYREMGYFEYEEIDNDFNYYFDELYTMLLEDEFFEKEEDEEEEEQEEQEFVNPLFALMYEESQKEETE